MSSATLHQQRLIRKLCVHSWAPRLVALLTLLYCLSCNADSCLQIQELHSLLFLHYNLSYQEDSILALPLLLLLPPLLPLSLPRPFQPLHRRLTHHLLLHPHPRQHRQATYGWSRILHSFKYCKCVPVQLLSASLSILSGCGARQEKARKQEWEEKTVTEMVACC